MPNSPPTYVSQHSCSLRVILERLSRWLVAAFAHDYRQVESAAERKLREQIDKTRLKEAEKAGAKDVRHAQQLLAKLGPVIASLEALLAHEHISIVADVIVQPVKSFLSLFGAAAGVARRTIKDGRCRGDDELIAIKDVASEVAACNKAKTLLTQTLATLAKAGRS